MHLKALQVTLHRAFHSSLLAALGGAKTFVGAMIKGGVVDATVFDPYEANLSAFLDETAGANGHNALKTDPNALMENRLRNSLEVVACIALDGIVKSIKFAALGRKANTEIKTWRNH